MEKKTKPSVFIRIEKYGLNMLGLGATHILTLQIRRGQKGNPKIMKFLPYVHWDVLCNPVFELNESE